MRDILLKCIAIIIMCILITLALILIWALIWIGFMAWPTVSPLA